MHGLLRSLTPDRLTTRCELVCFPYAGGGTRVFRDWPAHLSRLVNVSAVQLPGREHRMKEEADTDVERVVEHLVEAVAPLANAKLILFGHSLGATLAARVGQELFGGQSASDVVLIVAGRRAPWVAGPSSSARDLSDEELLGHLTAAGRLDPQLAANPEFAKLALPALKADLRLSDAAKGIAERSVSFPVIGLYGNQDTGTPLSSVRQWSRFTTGAYQSIEVAGDHFFLESNVQRVSGIVDAAARSLIGL